MEIVDFYPKTIHQIPDQDNPLKGDEECLLIVRDCPPVQNSEKALVIYFKPNKKINYREDLGTFGLHNRALQYCGMMKHGF